MNIFCKIIFPKLAVSMLWRPTMSLRWSRLRRPILTATSPRNCLRILHHYDQDKYLHRYQSFQVYFHCQFHNTMNIASNFVVIVIPRSCVCFRWFLFVNPFPSRYKFNRAHLVSTTVANLIRRNSIPLQFRL